MGYIFIESFILIWILMEAGIGQKYWVQIKNQKNSQECDSSFYCIFLTPLNSFSLLLRWEWKRRQKMSTVSEWKENINKTKGKDEEVQTMGDEVALMRKSQVLNKDLFWKFTFSSLFFIKCAPQTFFFLSIMIAMLK